MKESNQDESGIVLSIYFISLWSNSNNTTLRKVRFSHKQLVIIVIVRGIFCL